MVDTPLSSWNQKEIDAVSTHARNIADDPRSILPSFSEAGRMQASPDIRDILTSALLGFGKSIEASQRAAQTGDPFAAALAGIGGAASAPSAMALAQQRQQMAFQQQQLEAQQKLAMFEQLPIEHISPALAEKYGLHGVSMAAFEKFAPILERDQALQQKFLNPQERAVLEKNARGEKIGANDLIGVRQGVLPAGVMASAASSETTVQGLAQQLVSGEVPPSMLPGFGKMRSEALAAAKKLDSGFNASKAELDYQRRLNLTRYESGAQVQTPVRQIEGILPNLDNLKVLSARVPKSDVNIINKYGIKAASGLGSKEASDLQTLAALTSDEIQAIFGHGSDKKLDLAVDLLNTARSQDQFASAIDLVKAALVNRQRAFMGQHAATTAAAAGSSGFSSEFINGAKAELERRRAQGK